MPKYVDPDAIDWFRYPALAHDEQGRHWLRCEALLGLSAHTIDAYARGLDEFLAYCQRVALVPLHATRGAIAGFVGVLRQRVKTPASGAVPAAGLSNATLQQRLTAVRLFFDFLIEEGLRADNPVGRGRYTPGRAFGGGTERALVPRQQKLPWIPSDVQWAAANGEPWKFYDLGHGYCTYDFFDQCMHRMACAKCAYYQPKGSTQTQVLEGKTHLQRMLQAIPLGEEERAAVEDGIAAFDALQTRLENIPTPAGSTPRQLRGKLLPIVT